MRKLVIGMFAMLAMTLFAVGTMPARAYAAVDPACEKGSLLGFPSWFEYLDVEQDDTGSCSVVGPTDSLTGDVDWAKASAFIGIAVVEIILRIATLVAVGFVIFGGFRYITSQGEPDNTKSARQTIQNGLIGLVISLLATAIVAFIGNNLS